MAATEKNIGVVLCQQGDLENGLVHFQKALDIEVKSLGLDHVSVADTLNNMAMVHEQMGDDAKNLELTRKAHAIYLQALGPDHPKTQDIARFI